MCSAFREAVAVALVAAAIGGGCGARSSGDRGARPGGAGFVTQSAGSQTAPGQPARRVLRIAADPNNLPFSNDRLEGFENRIAQVIAADLGADVKYVWRAQRRGFFRHAFNDDGCEVVLGVPAGFDPALTTSPYYRSTYVFVSRADRGLDVRSFDDPALRGLRIGVPVVGDEGAAAPPGFALARRGIVDNVVGYTVYGDYRQDNPPARLIDAVAGGQVDVAVAWGPLAGYFAKRSGVALPVTPVAPEAEAGGLRFASPSPSA